MDEYETRRAFEHLRDEMCRRLGHDFPADWHRMGDVREATADPPGTFSLRHRSCRTCGKGETRDVRAVGNLGGA
jgi:hypothetical protein